MNLGETPFGWVAQLIGRPSVISFALKYSAHDALTLTAKPNKSLDASGGGVFLIMTGPAVLK